MKRRVRRRQYVSTELDITAFLNLMVILIPFLLITAVFSRVTVLDLYLPPEAQASSSAKKSFQLEVVIRKDSILVKESLSRLKKSIKATKDGFDYLKLEKILIDLKDKNPNKRDATILSEADIEYDTLVQVMDHVRMREVKKEHNIVLEELFPGISIGDAPRVTRK